MQAKIECGICYEDIIDCVVFSCDRCKKQAHSECINKWKTDTCAYCRYNNSIIDESSALTIWSFNVDIKQWERVF